MKTFPKPLSPEEEKHYLQKYKEGDVGARNILIERNLRLVAHVARKYQGTEDNQDDLISIGIIGLIKAVSTFDCEKNNRLATYAARCIENELLMMMRAKKKQSREVSIYEKIGVDQEGRELRLMDILESEPVDVLLVAPGPDWAVGADTPGATEWSRLAKRLSKEGVAALHIDARLMSQARFRRILADFRATFVHYHLWCTGRYDYVLTSGRAVLADKERMS